MILIANKTGEVDSAYHTLVKYINSPIPLVMVSWSENFIFNDELLNLKEWCCICYCEYGCDFVFTDTHLWGVNSENFPRYYNGDWIKFDNWVKENPPKLFFKRELLKKDVSNKILPIDYPAIVDKYIPQTLQEFNNRPISACYYWGRSHEQRIILHSNIWKGATHYNYSVCDNIYYFNRFMQNQNGDKYVSMYIPHYTRHEISELLIINGMSKIGIAPFGAGIKTFRHAEVSANSVMLTWNNEMAWSFDWIDKFNCLKCEIGEEVETIELYKNAEILYSIYLEGIKTFDKYKVQNYIPYLEKLIKQA